MSITAPLFDVLLLWALPWLGHLVRLVCYYYPSLIPKPVMPPNAGTFRVQGQWMRAVQKSVGPMGPNIVIDGRPDVAAQLRNNPDLHTILERTACRLRSSNLRPNLKRRWTGSIIGFIFHYLPWWAIFEIARQYSILSSSLVFRFRATRFMMCETIESDVVNHFAHLMECYLSLMSMQGGINRSDNRPFVIFGCLNQLIANILGGNAELGFTCIPDAFFQYINNGILTTLFAMEFKTVNSHLADPIQHLIQTWAAMTRRDSRVGLTVSPRDWSLVFGGENSAHWIRGDGSFESLVLTIITASLLGQLNPV